MYMRVNDGFNRGAEAWGTLQGLNDFAAQPLGFDPSSPPPGTILLTDFETNGFRVRSRHRRTIRQIAQNIIARMPGSHATCTVIVVEVEGHEDETGNPDRYGNLGMQRAAAVGNAIGARLSELRRSVPPANLRDVELHLSSAGPTRPIRSNTTSAGRSMNRRVEVRIRSEFRCI